MAVAICAAPPPRRPLADDEGRGGCQHDVDLNDDDEVDEEDEGEEWAALAHALGGLGLERRRTTTTMWRRRGVEEEEEEEKAAEEEEAEGEAEEGEAEEAEAAMAPVLRAARCPRPRVVGATASALANNQHPPPM